MLATIGTLATARQTGLSAGYVATEIIIRHYTLYIWLRQTNKQTNTNYVLLLQAQMIQTDKV